MYNQDEKLEMINNSMMEETIDQIPGNCCCYAIYC